MNVLGHLFQARIWREYAQAWDGIPTDTGVGYEWVKHILRVSKEECIKNSREYIKLAREKNKI